jgi:hypothetical protein
MRKVITLTCLFLLSWSIAFAQFYRPAEKDPVRDWDDKLIEDVVYVINNQVDKKDISYEIVIDALEMFIEKNTWQRISYILWHVKKYYVNKNDVDLVKIDKKLQNKEWVSIDYYTRRAQLYWDTCEKYGWKTPCVSPCHKFALECVATCSLLWCEF